MATRQGNNRAPRRLGVVVRESLRQNITRRRAFLGLSQAALAKNAALSRPIISAVEQGRGNPTLLAMERLAAALRCEVCDLLSRAIAPIPAVRPKRPGRADRVEGQRYSRSGRKPTLRNWLQNPPAGTKTAAAKKFGVDLTLLAETLALTPERRLRRLATGAAALTWLRQAKPTTRVQE